MTPARRSTRTAEAEGTEENGLSPEDVKDTVNRLHEITTMEITAEGSASSNMLATTLPIRYLSLYFLQYEFCPLYRLHRRGRDKKLMDPKVKQERTWMLGQGINNEKISYFDVLELLHVSSLSSFLFLLGSILTIISSL